MCNLDLDLKQTPHRRKHRLELAAEHCEDSAALLRPTQSVGSGCMQCVYENLARAYESALDAESRVN